MASRLHALEAPWIHVAEAAPAALTEWTWQRAAEDGRAVVRVLRGRKMRGWPALFDEVAAALQFPHFFDDNLNGLNDCLRDLSWLPASRYLLVISDAAELLREVAPEDLSVFLFLLHDVGRGWARPAGAAGRPGTGERPFHVVLHEHGPRIATLETRVLQAGVMVDRLPLP